MSSIFRRNIIIGVALFLAVLLFVTMGDDQNNAPDHLKMSPDMALQTLKDGNARFADEKPLHPDSDAARKELAAHENQGKYAFATVLSCSDSRVPVERIFDAGIMDLFVVRVAGNVVQGDEAGSIEYGLSHVHTPVLVVLGHTQCGAVTAAAHIVEGSSEELETNIKKLIAPIIPAAERTIKLTGLHGDDAVPVIVEQNVWQSITDLFMRSPSTRALVKSGKVMVVGAVYNLETGRINWLKPEKPAALLEEVESNPARVMDSAADEGHSEELAPASGTVENQQTVAPVEQPSEPAEKTGTSLIELQELATKAAELAKAANAAADAANRAVEEAAKTAEIAK